MSSTEWWRWWWSRFHDRINARGTWITILIFTLPTGCTVAAWLMGWDVTSPLVIGGIAAGSLFALGGYFVYLGWSTYPPALSPAQVAGRKLTLAEIPKLHPTCVKVALVGLGAVGKTTLLEHLTALPQTNAQTVSPEILSRQQ
jgi:hypothetical protein